MDYMSSAGMHLPCCIRKKMLRLTSTRAEHQFVTHQRSISWSNFCAYAFYSSLVFAFHVSPFQRHCFLMFGYIDFYSCLLSRICIRSHRRVSNMALQKWFPASYLEYDPFRRPEAFRTHKIARENPHEPSEVCHPRHACENQSQYATGSTFRGYSESWYRVLMTNPRIRVWDNSLTSGCDLKDSLISPWRYTGTVGIGDIRWNSRSFSRRGRNGGRVERIAFKNSPSTTTSKCDTRVDASVSRWLRTQVWLRDFV